MKRCILFTVAAIFLTVAEGSLRDDPFPTTMFPATNDNSEYSAEEQACLDDYQNMDKQPEGAMCTEQEDLAECLMEHFDGHTDVNDKARVNEILDKIGRAPNCTIDLDKIFQELGGDKVDSNSALDDDDGVTQRMFDYLECADPFLDVTTPQSKCDMYQEYIQCILSVEVNGGNGREIDDEKLQQAVDVQHFKDDNIPCELNVTKLLSMMIAEQLQVDVNMAKPLPPVPPAHLELAVERCNERLSNEFLISSPEYTCPKVDDYVQCYFSALKFHNLLKGAKDYSGLEDDLEERLAKYNLQCEFNIHEIVQAIKEGRPVRNTTGPTKLNDISKVLPESEQARIQVCFQNLYTHSRGTEEFGDTAMCNPYQQYLECVFGVMKKNNRRVDEEELSELQQLIDNEAGVCSISVSTLYNTVMASPKPTPAPQQDKHFCISGDAAIKNVCIGLPDGDYAFCPPKCQTGAYITCSNHRRIPSVCPNAYYDNFMYPLVFDSVDKACQYEAVNCPRPKYDDLPIV